MYQQDVLGAWAKDVSDIRVFNPLANYYNSKSLKSKFKTHGKEIERCYKQRIIKINNSYFTPAVLTCTGSIACQDNVQIFTADWQIYTKEST